MFKISYFSKSSHGNSWTQENVEEQKILVNEAISGQFLKDPELLKNGNWIKKIFVQSEKLIVFNANSGISQSHVLQATP